MSLDKARHEALRWLQTSFEDLDAAQTLLSSSKFSHACFLAQQTCEKALKALWHSLGEDPRGGNRFKNSFGNSRLKIYVSK